MNVPKKAQTILRRMKRRGYREIIIVESSQDWDDRFFVEVSRSDRQPVAGHEYEYEKTGPTVLSCCRNIEKQWRAEQ